MNFRLILKEACNIIEMAGLLMAIFFMSRACAACSHESTDTDQPSLVSNIAAMNMVIDHSCSHHILCSETEPPECEREFTTSEPILWCDASLVSTCLDAIDRQDCNVNGEPHECHLHCILDAAYR